MAETVSVAEMAVLASERLFSVFGWSVHALTDQNCGCLDKARHRKQKGKGTHPTDCVFNYIHPYTGLEIFVNTDLKSYAGDTIASADLTKAIRNLGQSTECANRSEEWKKAFIGREVNSEIIGMLFIYNHDQNYDSDFTARLVNLAPSGFDLFPETFVGVVGPARVCYLNSVAQDIKALHSDGKLPGKDNRLFFYPHLNRINALHQNHKTATLQTLLSPLIVLRYEFPDGEKSAEGAWRRGVYAYYDGKGESSDEFKYLINYFFKYQLASDKIKIFVCCAQPAADAAVSFSNAKRDYAKEYWRMHSATEEECLKKLGPIEFRSVPNFIMKFYERELGMRWPQ